LKSDRTYLQHILDCIDQINIYTKDGRTAFMSDRLIQDGVIRNLEIIGEATKQLSDEFCESHPQIPWSDMARFRDVLIHHYLGVDLKRVWNVVEFNLPVLKTAVEALLAQ
jgi:uncharacterized protein with HEPN domain